MNSPKLSIGLKSLIAAAALAALAPAHAVTYLGATAQDEVEVADYSTTGLVAFDIKFLAMAPVTLSFAIEAEDLAMPLQLNAVLRNFIDFGVDAYKLSLSTGSFAQLTGTVQRQFGGATDLAVAGGQARLHFVPEEYYDVEVGNPLGRAGAQNWQIDGLLAGSTLAITVTPVPEAGTLGMMAMGLGLVGWMRRRRS